MLAFGLSSHVLSLDEEFQVLPVHLRADEPVVEKQKTVSRKKETVGRISSTMPMQPETRKKKRFWVIRILLIIG